MKEELIIATTLDGLCEMLFIYFKGRAKIICPCGFEGFLEDVGKKEGKKHLKHILTEDISNL